MSLRLCMNKKLNPSSIQAAASTAGGAAAKGADGGHRTLRAALAALGGDELDTFPGMIEVGEPNTSRTTVESENFYHSPWGGSKCSTIVR